MNHFTLSVYHIVPGRLTELWTTCLNHSCLVGAMLGVDFLLTSQTPAQTFTTLHSFSGSDGANPHGSLILSGNILYGAAGSGGGTVFKIGTDGTGFMNLCNLPASSDGVQSQAPLILLGNTLYGTTPHAGSKPGDGLVFAVNTDGTSFTILHLFQASSMDSPGFVFTNIDGAAPTGLTLSGATLYGTAAGGGSAGNGTVFELNTDGMGFSTLHSFTASAADPLHAYTNSDGAQPNGVIRSDNRLYGTTWAGGISGHGTIFAVNIDGTGFTNLYTLTGGADGSGPVGELILSDNTLYGATEYGGESGNGTVFAISVDGTGFANLHSFTGSDGVGPWGGLILSSNTLYGTTFSGGASGQGTLFSLTLPPPQLTLIPSESSFILTWPTKSSGFSLLSTTNLTSPVWTPVSGANVRNGQNAVTNLIIGTQQFFRLSR